MAQRDQLLELTVEDAGLRRDLERFADLAADGHKPLLAFYSTWKAVVGRAWGQIKAKGGNFRGESWPGLADQYTRADGTEVPAWGGVPRAGRGFKKRSRGPERNKSTGERMGRVSGMVSGRRRPSGRRVTEQSVINQDTGALKSAILTNRPDVTASRLRIGVGEFGTARDYAGHVMFDLGRNPLQFFPEDQTSFQQIARAYLEELVRRFNGGTP